MAAAGCDLLLTGRDQAALEEVAGSVRAQNRKPIVVALDLRADDAPGRLVRAARREFGRLDILVNNAGMYEFSPLEGVTEEHFHKHFNVNVLGLLFTTKEAVKQMGPDGGSIINIGSVASSMRLPNSAVYSASKAAVEAITGVLAKELGPRKIRVNSISPGVIETEGSRAGGFVGTDFQKTVEAQAPLGRVGQPDDIAPTAVYLASSDSKYMTGETLLVSGGLR